MEHRLDPVGCEFLFFASIREISKSCQIRRVVAESLLVKHQLLILNRSRERAPVLRPIDRFIVQKPELWLPAYRRPDLPGLRYRD